MIQFNPHELIPAPYKNREQAFIKHLLLEGYLERLLRIVGWSAITLGYREIVFVDCFAGPWQDESNDLSSTSIGISIKLISRVQNDLAAKGKSVKFRAIYVEKDDKAYSRLERFVSLNSLKNVDTIAIHGDFTEKIQDILSQCPQDSFAFFFIDPKNWFSVNPTILESLLKRPGSEFLINFMYSFLNRHASMEAMKDKVAQMLGNDFEEKILPADPAERERFMLEIYRSEITKRAATSRGKPMSAFVTVLDPVKDRTKYHLIYLTSHPLGIIEFMTVSEKLDSIQEKVRHTAKLNKKAEDTKTTDMFGIDSEQAMSSRQVSIKDLESYWTILIGNRILKVNMDVYAHMLQQTMAYPSELQTALKNLINQGKVINLDADTSHRRTKWVDFEKKERLKLI